MQLTDLNRHQDIGANCLLLKMGPFTVVVDAGLHPKKTGHKSTPDFSKIDDFSVDYICITHCHLDHIGSLPILARTQPQAKIILTSPSKEILPRMLNNSHSVMLRQREELGINEYPLYTRTEIEYLEQRYFPLLFQKPHVFEKNGEKLEITLYSAGHILGACGFLFKYKHRSLFVTGDVLFRNQKTLKGASFPKIKVDTLVMETTRGLTETADATADDEMRRLVDVINHTLDRGGSCLIPVFALGRMQEILFILHEARRNKKLKNAPIFCSGLGVSLIEVFDEVSRKTGLVNFHKKILQDLNAKPLPKETYEGGTLPDKPSIYVVSSGMVIENTPSYMVAAALLGSKQNSICFVGYCDPETPGGKLLVCEHNEPFFFETIPTEIHARAAIERFELSGHANREELLQLVYDMDPRTVVLYHGDEEAREWVFDELVDQHPNLQVINPTPGDPVAL
ncbi:MAG: hypothetical protein A2Y14_00790 [Verrucomicrobia bacterium GWF2_51_19]|nr:MAG: hypothetical protein A2Y14_00790 [Verrucomicrobia bacterium GWF2_51_19]